MMPTITGTAMMIRLKSAVVNRRWTVLGATALLGATGYRQYKAGERQIEDAKKKKVLVLPFHRMKIVEEKKSPFRQKIMNGIENNGSAADKVIEMQADELVSLIHEAARDPSIVSLFGIFGNGGAISTGGWAHLEEIRNALKKFAETTSIHEDKDNGLPDTDPGGRSSGKMMYAYSNNFGGEQSMKEYYLASVFSQIHLQPQGDLNLYGLHATNTFFRGFLKKYGITVHVWKHGAYKNMANVFTHSNYNKEHFENVAGILLPINKHVSKEIFTSRHKLLKQYGYDFEKFWSMIENVGSFPADVAHQIGFVDHLPLKNPLNRLVKNNKQKMIVLNEGTQKIDPNTDTNSTTNTATADVRDDENTVQVIESTQKIENRIASKKDSTDDNKIEISSIGGQWKLTTDPDSFTADSQITIDSYAQQIANARRKEAEDWKFFQSLKKASESNSLTKQLLSLVGYSAPYYNIDKNKFSEEKATGLQEKIAVMKINGTIGESTARKAEKALRRIKEQKDVKCVVLRVDSPGGSIHACESLYQEIQDIPQKVVVSFGNVSASGGYYISSKADHIFASSSSITGSIGVVMMRVDFKEMAKRYGITFDSVPTSALSGSNDPFYPINKRMDENFANQVDRSYHHFKSLVSHGRNLNMKAVEAIAKGRVWTGEQAQQNGLVDKLGGLHEAIAFAQQNFTSSGDAQVVHWPPKRSFWEILTNRDQNEDGANDIDDLDIPDLLHAVLGGVLNSSNHLTSILGSSASTRTNKNDFLFSSPSIPVLSGIMLTIDENAAIKCMLEDTNVSEEILAFDDIINTVLL